MTSQRMLVSSAVAAMLVTPLVSIAPGRDGSTRSRRPRGQLRTHFFIISHDRDVRWQRIMQSWIYILRAKRPVAKATGRANDTSN